MLYFPEKKTSSSTTEAAPQKNRRKNLNLSQVVSVSHLFGRQVQHRKYLASTSDAVSGSQGLGVMTLGTLKQQAATSINGLPRFGGGGLTWRINSEALEIWGFQPAIFSVITDHSTGARNYQNLWLKTNMNMFRMFFFFFFSNQTFLAHLGCFFLQYCATPHIFIRSCSTCDFGAKEFSRRLALDLTQELIFFKHWI